MQAKIFEDIGLTSGEAKVYSVLLELGSTTITAIVKKSGVSSSKVYEILDRLCNKGLVTYIIQNKVRYYKAVEAFRLLDYLKKRKKEIHEQEVKIKEILPKLLSIQKEKTKLPEVQIYLGKEGIKTAREKVLKICKKGDTVYAIGGNDQAERVLESYWIDYHRRRKKAGIKARYIIREAGRKTLGKAREKTGLIKIKYLEIWDEMPLHIDIYKDYTEIAVFGDILMTISIHDKNIAKTFKAFFYKMWDIAKE